MEVEIEPIYERRRKGFLDYLGINSEGVFSDFFLFALSHMANEDLIEEPKKLGDKPRIKEDAIQKIEERIKYGIEAIRKNTNKGDLIVIENPFGRDFKSFKKSCQQSKEIMATANPEEVIRELWTVYRHSDNFYKRLADEARRVGRRVISLDSRHTRAGGPLWLALGAETEKSKARRLEYILKPGRDLRYIKRIQRLRPKMAVMAAGHASIIGWAMRPKRNDFYPAFGTARTHNQIEIALELHRAALDAKFERLESARYRIQERKRNSKRKQQTRALRPTHARA